MEFSFVLSLCETISTASFQYSLKRNEKKNKRRHITKKLLFRYLSTAIDGDSFSIGIYSLHLSPQEEVCRDAFASLQLQVYGVEQPLPHHRSLFRTINFVINVSLRNKIHICYEIARNRNKEESGEGKKKRQQQGRM